MDELALARHGESEHSARALVGGDTPLTPRGREQARALGARVRDLAVGACVTSGARRARETAALALDGRDVPIDVDPDLGDIRFGVFEGRPLDEYRSWVESHRPDIAPDGGESRAETLLRFARAFRAVLGRPEQCILVVAHGLTLRSVLDPAPRPVVVGAPYGGCVRLDRRELLDAVERLEAWCEQPAW
ncbi:MAG: histidine phosphatase family protein [Gaiellaceae bacterium]|jgi:broad specificity phosphatase PhoE